MSTVKFTNLRTTNINTKNIKAINDLNIISNKKTTIKAPVINMQGKFTYNGKELATKADILNVLNEIGLLKDKDIIIKENIKSLREDIDNILDYDLEKPGVQDMDGDTVYYIKAAQDITDTINNAVTGDEIKIKSNVSIGDTGSNITFNNKNILLNLDKNTLTAGNGGNDNIMITNGTVTINGNGTIKSNDPYDKTHSTTVITVNTNGHLVLNETTVTAVMDDAVNKGQFGIGVFNNGQITVNNANITTGWYCITGNGGKTNANSIVTINDGNLTSTVDYALYHPDPGTLIVNGGTITGGAGAISANAGNIVINGGVFKTTGDGDTGNWNDGTSGQTPAVINLNGRYGAIKCEINDGTFIAMNNAPIVITGNKYPVNIIIKGGRFSQKPNEEWIAEGYVVSDNTDENGFYIVQAK